LATVTLYGPDSHFSRLKPISPSAKITSPRPATIHQTVWVASVKAGPPRAIAAPATGPDTATPRVVPAWRLVDATEAATPRHREEHPGDR
jgi:hypothetical protein